MSKRTRRIIDTTFGDVHYWHQGAGAPLLLVHQSTQSADEFDRFAQQLISADDIHVVAVDLPGHGCSGDPERELSIDEHADALVCVLDELGCQSAHVLGHHGGGMVAASLASRLPDRVNRLILSSVGIPEAAVRDRILNEPMSRDLPMDDDGQFLAETWKTYRAMSAPGMGPDTWFKPFSTGLRSRLRSYDMHRAAMVFDYEAALSSLTQPVLMLKAEHDAYSGDVDQAAALVSDASVKTVPGCGAWQFFEDVGVVAGIVGAFLGGR